MPKFVALFFLLLSACSGPYEFPTSTVTVNVAPRLPDVVSTGGTILFQGSETTIEGRSTTVNLNSTNFTWTIREGASGGTLAPLAGNQSYYRYTAPATPGTYHVVITSTKDTSKSDVALIVVN